MKPTKPNQTLNDKESSAEPSDIEDDYEEFNERDYSDWKNKNIKILQAVAKFRKDKEMQIFTNRNDYDKLYRNIYLTFTDWYIENRDKYLDYSEEQIYEIYFDGLSSALHTQTNAEHFEKWQNSLIENNFGYDLNDKGFEEPNYLENKDDEDVNLEEQPSPVTQSPKRARKENSELGKDIG